MTEEAKKFQKLVENSKKILITSHISPDPDAVSSLLLMGATLKLNFPDKQTVMALEDKPEDLDFLHGFDEAEYSPVYNTLVDFKPDLFILLDGNNYERCSRHDGEKIRKYIADHGVHTAIIDHHELAGKYNSDIFINNQSTATVKDVYEICFDGLSLKKPESAAQIAMIGFYADSGGFVYVKAGNQNEVFGFAERLIADGADIEKAKNVLNSFTEDDMKVIAELSKNVNSFKNYTYSYLSDEFIAKWVRSKKDPLSLGRPTNEFQNNYTRNIAGRSWGFVIYRNVLQGDDYYSVGFRSQGGKPDVSIYASKLGGGGHKPAAGAKFEAKNIEEAIAKVKSVINGAVDED